MHIFLFLKTFAFFKHPFCNLGYFCHTVTSVNDNIEIMNVVMNDPRCCGGAYCSDIQLVNGLWVGDLPHLRRLKLLICISL